jgi:alpha-D-ribose 1-methylphosphonate 5-triphosphate synthase subunit PhnH
MKPEEIEVGRVYINRGAGRTTRKVIAIGPEHAPREWHGSRDTSPAGAPGVLFEQEGVQRTLYLSSFASWAGRKIR